MFRRAARPKTVALGLLDQARSPRDQHARDPFMGILDIAMPDGDAGFDAGAVGNLDEPRLRKLLEAGRTLVSDLDHESVLSSLLEVARDLTGARYAALGITAPDGSLERFLFTGIDQKTRDRIGELPRGRGVLGLLIDDPRPIRIPDVSQHPRSFGFPAGHPAMSSFLGVPIEIRGQTFGNLYLTEKANATEFGAGDEEAAVTLARWAAIAIENARLYTGAVEHGSSLERSVARLEATSDIARAIGGETRLDRVLETVVKRARALVGAKSVLVLLEDRDSLAVAAVAGAADPSIRGTRLPADSSAWRRVMNERESERVPDIGSRLGIAISELGIRASTALLVPLSYRTRSIGVLAAFDREGDDPTFDAEDELLLGGFAASAATALATAQSMAEARLRDSIEVAERERARWARELHDETLQSLGALRVRLAASLRLGEAEGLTGAVRTAVTQIEDEIANLRALITELRPAALDDLGVGAAIESLVRHHEATTGLDIRTELVLAREDGVATERLDRELESAVYRVVQEALTNVAKHAQAERVWIEVAEDGGWIQIIVRDDGVGFDMDRRGHGFGLVGMRERVALTGGSLAIVSTPGSGTELRGRLPVDQPSRTRLREDAG